MKEYVLAVDQSGETLCVNPSVLFTGILNGHDLSELKLPKKEMIPDLESVKVTLAISMVNGSKMMIVRHIVKPVPINWKKLDNTVVDVLEALEELNVEVVKLLDELQHIDQELLKFEEIKELDEDEIMDMMDLHQKKVEIEPKVDSFEARIDALKNNFFILLQEHNNEIFVKLHEVRLTPEGPVEVSVSELIREELCDIPPDICNLFKSTVMSYRKKGE